MTKTTDTSTLGAEITKPGAADTAPARHRRYELPCTGHLRTVETLVRDVRHEQAAAAPDLADWLVYLDLDGKRPRTIYAYTRAVAPLLRAHPEKAIGGFTHSDINAELMLIPRQSRHISRSIYNQFFEWAVFDERIEKSPMGRVPKMRAGHRRPTEIFTDTEAAQLEALPVPDGPLWMILFGSGLRRGEARHLKREHVDVARSRIMVFDGKGGKDRVVPVKLPVLQAVADLDLFERLEPGEYLWYLPRFPVGDHRRRRDPVGDSTFERWYRRGINDAGIRYLSPHKTRHTYAYGLKEAGYDLEERQLLMGHESPNTTQRQYPAKSIEDVARKMGRVDA